jgi:ribosomal protein L24E
MIMSAQIGRKSIEMSLDENPSKCHWTKIHRNFIGRKSVEISLDENPSKSHWTKIHRNLIGRKSTSTYPQSENKTWTNFHNKFHSCQGPNFCPELSSTVQLFSMFAKAIQTTCWLLFLAVPSSNVLGKYILCFSDDGQGMDPST